MDPRNRDWESYKKKLEDELAVKKHFLQQTEDILLDNTISGNNTDVDGKHGEPMPMFKPDRTDPLGYAAMSYMQNQRLSSSKKILKESMDFEYPANIDYLLHELSEKLDKLLSFQENRTPGNSRQEEYLKSLENLVKNNFTENYNTTKLANKDFGDHIWDLMQRLIECDRNLTYGDFKPYGISLYRLLRHNGCIVIKMSEKDNASVDDNLVKLIDFNKEYI